MARLLRSSQRLVLAGFDPAELLTCIKALLRVDRAWCVCVCVCVFVVVGWWWWWWW
jgi:hypothetical protein